MSRDSFNAGLFRAHFLIERMVRLQIQHARTLPVVQRFHRIVADIVPDILIYVVCCYVVGAGQNFWRCIIIADDVGLFRCTMFRYDFYVSFVIWRMTVVVRFA